MLRITHVLLLVVLLLAGAPLAASATVIDAPIPSITTVTPGDRAYIGGGQCTTNFGYVKGSVRYIGIAAHCFTLSGSTQTNGCLADSRGPGTVVRSGSSSSSAVIGTLAYSSWHTMKAAGTNPESFLCRYNDFALIQLASGVSLSPCLPYWNGPDADVAGGPTPNGGRVYGYGNSSLRPNTLGLLPPKSGFGSGMSGDGLSHLVYMVTPGIPGDSGSALINPEGRAIGVLSTVSVLGYNNYTDIASALDYAAGHGFPGVTVATCPTPFDDGLLGLGSPVGHL